MSEKSVFLESFCLLVTVHLSFGPHNSWIEHVSENCVLDTMMLRFQVHEITLFNVVIRIVCMNVNGTYETWDRFKTKGKHIVTQAYTITQTFVNDHFNLFKITLLVLNYKLLLF